MIVYISKNSISDRTKKRLNSKYKINAFRISQTMPVDCLFNYDVIILNKNIPAMYLAKCTQQNYAVWKITEKEIILKHTY